MAKKEEKNKVGRPRLADSKTKKESICTCCNSNSRYNWL